MEMREKQTELLNRETSRLPYPLGRAFHPDQTDGVNLHRYGLLPHCEIPKRAENPANVSTAFRRERKGFKPHLYRSRLQVRDEMLAPLRYDVKPNPRPIRAPCVLAVWHLFFFVLLYQRADSGHAGVVFRFRFQSIA